MKGLLLAIDPGTFASGWVLMKADSRQPLACGKDPNEELLRDLSEGGAYWAEQVVIEMMTSYGARGGREVLETCVWIGRFLQAAAAEGMKVRTMYRRDVKMELVDTPRATDADIRQMLVDRFAYGVPNLGKGTKAEPGWFYGFRADIWQAYALGVAWTDRQEREEVKHETD